MTQDEMEQLLQALGQFATEQQAINRQQQEFNRQQLQLNERIVTAIERLDITMQAIKNMLERGNGHEPQTQQRPTEAPSTSFSAGRSVTHLGVRRYDDAYCTSKQQPCANLVQRTSVRGDDAEAGRTGLELHPELRTWRSMYTLLLAVAQRMRWQGLWRLNHWIAHNTTCDSQCGPLGVSVDLWRHPCGPERLTSLR
jgi:hypothetical protein